VRTSLGRAARHAMLAGLTHCNCTTLVWLVNMTMQLLTQCCTTVATCRRVQAVDRACAHRLLHRRFRTIQRADRHQQSLPGLHRADHRLRQASGTLLACHHAWLLCLNPATSSTGLGQPCRHLRPVANHASRFRAGLDAELPLTAASHCCLADAVASTRHHGIAFKQAALRRLRRRCPIASCGSRGAGLAAASASVSCRRQSPQIHTVRPDRLPRCVHCRPLNCQ